MFVLFKKKQPTQMDALIRLIYGPNPPRKSADLERSITIAHVDLLCEMVPWFEVKNAAEKLSKVPIPYSTYDLAVSTALGFFEHPEYVSALQDYRVIAKMQVTNWVVEGKVAKLLASCFSEVLYRVYKRQDVSHEENMRTLGTYVALLDTHPHDVMDASWLPAEKQKMIDLFKILWLTGNDERRKKIEGWWCLLSHFQPGVGAVPVDIEISKDNPTVQEWRERKEQVEKWLEIAIAEDKKYEREIEALRQQFRR